MAFVRQAETAHIFGLDSVPVSVIQLPRALDVPGWARRWAVFLEDGKEIGFISSRPFTSV